MQLSCSNLPSARQWFTLTSRPVIDQPVRFAHSPTTQSAQSESDPVPQATRGVSMPFGNLKEVEQGERQYLRVWDSYGGVSMTDIRNASVEAKAKGLTYSDMPQSSSQAMQKGVFGRIGGTKFDLCREIGLSSKEYLTVDGQFHGLDNM